MMDKVLEDIRSLRCQWRYTTLDWWNITCSYSADFHDPQIKRRQLTNRIPYDVQRRRNNDNNLTGWRYVSLAARQEGKLLKSVYYTIDSFCTCPDFQYRKKKEGHRCKHQIDLDVKKATNEVTGLFTGETGIKTLIDAFVGQWERPPKPSYQCERAWCNKKARWCLDDGEKVCNKHRPKVEVTPVKVPRCEEPWCMAKAKNTLSCGKKVCGRHIPKVEAMKL